jgi:2-polyprenyl-3-methyl-5-hydroxy-6-metoxy-1,4-benzoquinol methylase
VLAENEHLLPPGGGRALDLACGLGGNAVFLARRGFEVDAVDISEVGIEGQTGCRPT